MIWGWRWVRRDYGFGGRYQLYHLVVVFLSVDLDGLIDDPHSPDVPFEIVSHRREVGGRIFCGVGIFLWGSALSFGASGVR